MSNEAAVNKTTRILHRNPDGDDGIDESSVGVYFEQMGGENDDEFALGLVMLNADFDMLGRPETITLSIEPGDKLND